MKIGVEGVELEVELTLELKLEYAKMGVDGVERELVLEVERFKLDVLERFKGLVR